jgi:hypothetical protein
MISTLLTAALSFSLTYASPLQQSSRQQQPGVLAVPLIADSDILTPGEVLPKDGFKRQITGPLDNIFKGTFYLIDCKLH